MNKIETTAPAYLSLSFHEALKSLGKVNIRCVLFYLFLCYSKLEYFLLLVIVIPAQYLQARLGAYPYSEGQLGTRAKVGDIDKHFNLERMKNDCGKF
jgi:hypothetical protein